MINTTGNAGQAGKFGFKVRTRNGSIVERILISAESEKEAQDKLFQMYYRCEILEAWRESAQARIASASFEDLADLIARDGEGEPR